MDDRLANVSWEMGQTLLPEHLCAQQDSILANMAQRFDMYGLPFYGVGKLKLNETLLSEGIFSVQEMSLVMSSGLLLDLPGNSVLSPFNLNVSGTTSVAVYLHVLKQAQPEGKMSEGWQEQTNLNIPRVIYSLVLSSEQVYPDITETIKLAEFDKSPEGIWQLSLSFIPPLLQVGRSPFLKKPLAELAESLELFQYNLSMDVASALSGDILFSVKQCLKSVFKARRFLANLATQVHLHPYYLYEMLYILYADVCFYRNLTPDNICAAYEHSQLSTLKDLIETLNEQMRLVRSRPPYLPFELKDNVYQIKLPQEIRQAAYVYLLIQKDQVVADINIENFKLAGLSRLSLIHQMALHGIPLKKVERPPFQHSFGAEVEFYLFKEGEEWDHALNEMAVAFYDRSELKNTSFYLYWRTG